MKNLFGILIALLLLPALAHAQCGVAVSGGYGYGGGGPVALPLRASGGGCGAVSAGFYQPPVAAAFAPVYQIQSYQVQQRLAVGNGYGYGYGGGGQVQARFGNQFGNGFGGGFGGGGGRVSAGGGGNFVSNVLDSVGRIANSPAGSFALGAFTGAGGFRR